MIFPKCAIGFKQWLNSNNKWKHIYYNLGSPLPFDISLRECIYSNNNNNNNNNNKYPFIKKETYTQQEKQDIYHKIYFNYRPKSIEIGSSINNINDFLDYIKDYQKIGGYVSYPNYVLVPNKKRLLDIIKLHEINYFSFITSISNSFQLEYTQKTILDNEKEIITMIEMLDINTFRVMDAKIKLYVSCINYCPIKGKIDNDFIVNKLLNLNNIKVDNICLLDTCGKLTSEDFEYIVDTCNLFGLPYSKLSLQLYLNKEREEELEKIIYMALDRKIIDFDVSMIESNNESFCISTLSYDFYYKVLVKYILYKTENQ